MRVASRIMQNKLVVRVVKGGLGPLMTIFALWFAFAVVPALPFELQMDVEGNPLGLMMAMFGALTAFVCLLLSRQELKAQRKSNF